jgi:hypothetical protein
VLQGPAVAGANNQVLDATGSGVDVTVQGVTFVLQGPSHYVTCNYMAFLTIDNCSFTGIYTPWSYLATTGGQIIILNNIHLYADVGAVLTATEGGSIISGAWYTNFYTHSINMANSFALANGMGEISLYYGYVNLTGIAYGYRYISANNSLIYTASGAAQWLPGNLPGVTTPDSVYN